MNRGFIKITVAAVVALAVSLPIVADQEFLEVNSFDGVDIGTGIQGTVSCGDKDTVTLHGDKRDLDLLVVKVKGGKLDISRRTSAGNILNNLFGEGRDNTITVEIVTTGQISNIEASTGSSLYVPECAVNNSFVEVDAGTGASVTLEGSTATLELDLSTGAEFNNKSESFKVDVANVDLSTGAVANLCGATTISGDASTGAVISASKTSDTKDMDYSLGAESSSSACR